MSSVLDDPSRFDQLDCVVVRFDRQAGIAFINRHGCELCGGQLADLRGKPLGTLIDLHDWTPPDDTSTEVPRQFKADLLRADDGLSPHLWNLTIDADNPIPFLLIGIDVGRLCGSRPSAEMFQTVSDNYSGSIIITDADNRIAYANPSVLRITGYGLEELLGQSPSIFNSGQTSPETFRDLWETLDGGGIWRGDFINRRKDGSQFLENKTIAAIRDGRGKVQFHLAIGEDFSKNPRYHQRIEHLLTFDQLTGLPNRSAFLNRAVAALDSSRHSPRDIAILYVELDDFHVISDVIGSAQGDTLLIEMAVRIRKALRQEDQLAHLGHNQFGILLNLRNTGNNEEFREVAERIMEAVREPCMHGERTINVTASVGIACHPYDGGNAAELLSHAVSAAGEARKAGGDCYCRFDSHKATAVSRQRALVNDLYRAIDAEEMVLHFQPQANLFSGRIVGAEALIRWQHPQRGLIFPGEFIPLAEQGNAIVRLGEWVIHAACRQMRQWLDAGLPGTKIAINLGARHFLASGLHATIAEALSSNRIDPSRLEIEITESTMMQDVATAIRSATQLKEIGVRLALDDFGTSYSSLAYLSRFPIDVVKIDQSFVRDITTNPTNAAIAQATIAMAHKLGKLVLAEGIESEEQMRYLQRNECDQMQGYFLAKPMPADRFAELLAGTATFTSIRSDDDAKENAVLFLDDEGNILSSIRRTLRREGYEILTANNADEAFSILAKRRVQVIVSDQRMPEMNGTEFLERVKNLYPNTVRMVLSGYSEVSAVADAINKGAVYRFMLKPWEDETLKEEIVGALRHWRELYGPETD